MTPEYVVQLGQDTAMLVLYVAGPTLIVGLVVGLAVSIFQAVTQVHEMTLTFIPKIVAVAIIVSIMLPWTIRRMVDFTANLFLSIPALVG